MSTEGIQWRHSQAVYDEGTLGMHPSGMSARILYQMFPHRNLSIECPPSLVSYSQTAMFGLAEVEGIQWRHSQAVYDEGTLGMHPSGMSARILYQMFPHRNLSIECPPSLVSYSQTAMFGLAEAGCVFAIDCNQQA